MLRTNLFRGWEKSQKWVNCRVALLFLRSLWASLNSLHLDLCGGEFYKGRKGGEDSGPLPRLFPMPGKSVLKPDCRGSLWPGTAASTQPELDYHTLVNRRGRQRTETVYTSFKGLATAWNVNWVSECCSWFERILARPLEMSVR